MNWVFWAIVLIILVAVWVRIKPYFKDIGEVFKDFFNIDNNIIKEAEQNVPEEEHNE